jgi:CRP/FNR family cyclic AMP-dependent transcriptional regulator
LTARTADQAMSNNPALIALLARTDLFKGLDDAALSACAAAFREVKFAKGEMLFARGETGNQLFIVSDGRVRLAVVTGDGRELSFRHAVTGDVVGEIAALDGGPRSADAIALSKVVTYSLERAALEGLYARQPAVAASIVNHLCRRIRQTSEQLESIALYPIEVRLARFLLVALGDRKKAAGRRIPLELGFSQGELAQLLGASRPKVNAAFGVLEDMDAIKRTIDRIFCDPDKLAEIVTKDDE